MSRVLLVIGLLATAAGFVTIGFGIPINAFSLGNTLIVAGTIAVAAGLILVGLASAVAQLRRIAEALHARPLPQLARSAGSVEALVTPATRAAPAPSPQLSTRMPPPPPPPPRPPDARQPAPVSPRAAEQRTPSEAHTGEPRFTAPAGGEPPLEWLRARPKPPVSAGQASSLASVTSEPAMAGASNEAPFSPRPLQRQSMTPPPEASQEARMWAPGRVGTGAEPEWPEPVPHAAPVAEPPRTKNGGPFDSIWPERPAAAPARENENREAALETPPPSFVMRPHEERPPERRSDTGPKPAERTPAILKSGVIDGMPYTLYADGSIEAELPQGTLRFASVDALRAHLEKHG
jgi:hypothetical protein